MILQEVVHSVWGGSAPISRRAFEAAEAGRTCKHTRRRKRDWGGGEFDPSGARRPVYSVRATWKPAKDWVTGINSSVLMLRCGGSSATHNIVAAMSAPLIGFAPR